MNILIIGGGGREHALAWKAAQSPLADRVFVAPGNAGTAREPGLENVPLAADDIPGLVAFAREHGVGLAVVGPEAPLVAGVVDAFTDAGLRCFGPSREAARLEGSKSFTKDFLARHGIPTGAYGSFSDESRALEYLHRAGVPIVVKADGLAAGKGVVLARDMATAEDAVRAMVSGNRFGEAGHRVVIEELLEGEEASFIVMVDGEHILPMASSQDHKARDDGDRGPNTGGMGAYSPAPVVTPGMHDRIMAEVIRPTVAGLAAEGTPYRGFLYAGLMIGADGTPRVLEYNCRFGDPETQPIMLRLRSDLVALCLAGAEGRLDTETTEWDERAALGVVMAAGGYPEAYARGDVIHGLSDAGEGDDLKVFHAGTAQSDGAVVTAGGRVLCVTALGASVAEAQARAYEGVRRIHWERAYYRTDIGRRAIAGECLGGFRWCGPLVGRLRRLPHGRRIGPTIRERLRTMGAAPIHPEESADMARKTRRFKYDYLESTPKAIQRSISNRLVYSIGKDPFTATESDWLRALAFVVRDRLIERWMETHRRYYREDAKRVYYLSMEFLIGRTLGNSLLNVGFMEECAEALGRLGMDLEALRELEHDAALGNGGLGRLAACVLDAMATLGLPGTGYGIRYEYGMFRQRLRDGQQVELPESWLSEGNPWEFARPEVAYPVRFGGRVADCGDESGRRHWRWVDGEEVLATAYDTPIPGYRNDTVNNLRLWSARASRGFDLGLFNRGDYIRAVQDKALTENLSKVLYPDDSAVPNQELRLKQQYFFVSASLQDILRRFLAHHDDLGELPDKVAIQLNDTHPAIAVPELMRLLLDEHRLEWGPAWDITVRTCAYTNHTLMPEALETWPVGLFERLLPRHMQLIYEINRRFLHGVRERFPDDAGIVRRVSLLDEHGGRRIRMAHLAIVGCSRVNGVSALHTRLLRERTFRDFDRLFPDRIINVTNGITPRRWLALQNPGLARLITEAIGPDWVRDLDRLEELRPLADDAEFRRRFAEVKTANKRALAGLVRHYMGRELDPGMLFDVQVKRIHEYKRQLLNVLRVVTLYNRLREEVDHPRVARTVLFAGKAAPGYYMAKLVIRLINDLATVIDADPASNGSLQVLFIPNYDVTTAGDIIPAAELSQQISTAGTEASGTGNMKLALNGALTMGTLDGANVEIRDSVGPENIFTFGHTEQQLQSLHREGYSPGMFYESDPELRRAIDQIGSGFFSPEEPGRYRALIDALIGTGRDRFMVCADFRAYLECSDGADRLYADDPSEWTRRAIINTAMMGRFSIDRTVEEYARRVWRTEPVTPEAPE